MKADTIYSNFDSSYDFQSGTGLTAGLGAAVPFTVGLTAPDGFAYVLSEVQFAAFTGDGDPGEDPVTVALYSSTGSVPDQQLASQQIDVAADNGDVYQVDFANGPTLETGGRYWIVLTDPESQVTWNSNCIDSSCETSVDGEAGMTELPPFGDEGWQYNDGEPQGAVEVDAELESATPEPGTLAMLGTGMFALLVLASRRVSRPVKS